MDTLPLLETAPKLIELLSIDSLCIKFCQWYNHNNGNKLLSFEGINLGSLFRVEFYNFLIGILVFKF